eukprot:TRINITY_DN5462_c0_g1_i1.p3 TRINITY_DN5462_c0_g1~~TRINITY_DN5462_c0_g1_i1.p3  ORF type:complete len:135 (-),score=34.23 TRINITY_DN5462_c0_g1_i1:4-408(-)
MSVAPAPAPATPVTYTAAPVASHVVMPPAGSMVAPAQAGYFQFCRPAGAPMAPAMAAPMPVYSQQHMPITSMTRAATPLVTMPSMVAAPSMVVAPTVSMTQPAVQTTVPAAAAPAATAKKAKKSKKAAKKGMCC